MNKIFIDQNLESSFKNDGYVIVPFLGEQEIREIKEIYFQNFSGITSGFYSSLYSSDSNYKKKVDDELISICGDLHKNILSNYSWLVSNFMIKEPGQKSELPVHQDWNLVDEDLYTSVNCWIPISIISPKNGPLMVMPGSHRIFKGVRGSPQFPSSLDGIRDHIRNYYLKELIVAPGHAAIFDTKLVHFSPANKTENTRIALSINYIPNDSTPLHYFKEKNGPIELFEVDREFFRSFNIGDRPLYGVKKTINNHVPERFDPKLFDQTCQKLGIHSTKRKSIFQRIFG